MTDSELLSQVKIETCDGRWFDANDQLHLCIVQTRPPSTQDIIENRSRPHILTTLKTLLVDDGAGNHSVLKEMVTGGRPSLVIIPEYALGSSDWLEVDRMISSYPFPVILIAGFGASSGAAIKSWHNIMESHTVKIDGWSGDQSIADSRNYSGGWCWVHIPSNSTKCYSFFKNYLEQQHECVLIPNIDTGQFILCLQFTDLVLFPLICADILCSNDGAPMKRVNAWLSVNNSDTRHILVAGILHQNNPAHELWQRGINATINLSHTSPIILAVSNHSTDSYCSDENRDQWRNLSGVFINRTHFDKSTSFPITRMVIDRDISAAMLRVTDCCAAAGPIRWENYGAVTGAFLWQSNVFSSMTSDNYLQPPDLFNHVAYELNRFINRNEPNGYPIVKRNIGKVTDHISSGSYPSANDIFLSLLYGLTRMPKEAERYDIDKLYNIEDYVKAGVYSIAAILSINGIQWNSDSRLIGQLYHNDKYILIWTDPKRHASVMVREMQAWVNKTGPHKTLIVIAKGNMGEVSEGRISQDRRADFTAAPDPTVKDITEPKTTREIYAIRFGSIGNIFVTPNKDNPEGKIESLLGIT